MSRLLAAIFLLAALVVTGHAQPAGPTDLALVAAPGRVRVPEVVGPDQSAVLFSVCEGDAFVVEFSVRNFGNQNGQVGTYFIRVNGQTVLTDQNLTVLAPGDQLNIARGLFFAPTVAGTTSIDIEVEFSGVGDTTPGNNQATRFLTVERCLPNLAFDTRASTPQPLFLSTTGDQGDASTTFNVGDAIFLDAVWGNLEALGAEEDMRGGYNVSIRLDGTPIGGAGPLAPLVLNGLVGFDNALIPALQGLPSGTYELTVLLDPDDFEDETNENDNTRSVLFDVVADTQPADLGPFTPAGWSGPVVIADAPNMVIDAAEIDETEIVYINFAFANFGPGDAGPFDVWVTLNDGPPAEFEVSAGLAAGFFIDGVDLLTAGPLPAGEYTVSVSLDPLDSVVETDELNNMFSSTFTVVPAAGCNDADLAPPLDVIDLADINAFVSAFTGGDLVVDLNSDGILDLADIIAFVDAFTAGCP